MLKRKIRRAGTFVAALGLVATMVVAGSASARTGDDDATKAQGKINQASSNYIVRMIQSPVVAYDGGVPGYKATRPAKGKKIDDRDPDVVKYVGYLDSKHDEALAAVGNGKKVYDYRYSFNGFAATLSKDQVAKLEALPNVLTVEKQQTYTVDTSTTPSFLGLSQPGGLWDKLGGVGKAGEDVVIGDVDTGVWPEALSFSDRTGSNPNGVEGKLNYQQIPGWHAKCTPGEAFNASMCNQKLIGAQWFAAGYGQDNIIPEEYLSPRDFDGHGSHTASTAGGNNGVQATGIATALGKISGMAPRARISVYKALYESADHSTASGTTTDLVAAIDQAVADGVDVINYSISGSTTSFLSAPEVAFLFAEDAGIFVSASAGNSGPTASTVAHAGPWLMTVAAGTHSRGGDGKVTLGDGTVITGASLTPGVGPAPLVYAGDVKTAAAPLADAKLCFPASLDAAKVAGKIVVCDRGVNARVEKSDVVKSAGGVGMVLANVTANSLNADLHVIPTVHIQNTDRPTILNYIALAGATATATIAQGVINNAVPAPDIAVFSSRGPSLASGDQLKPDITAPGQDVLAAVAPPNHQGRDFDLESGTSMSAPHITGIAADLIQAHRDWTPDMIKSAMITTAVDLRPGAANRNLFSQGAGQVNGTSAIDPGLVYKSGGFLKYFGFLCGTGQLVSPSCATLKIDPSDLNLPSIAIGDLAGTQTITRTVTNVGSSAATYNVSKSGLAGLDVVITPSSLTLNRGESKSYTVQFTTTTATLNAYTQGFITWSDGAHSVRSPVAIRPVAIAAPGSLSGTGASGSTSFSITTGYNGPLTIAKRGLIPADAFNQTVVDDPTDHFVKDGPGTTKTVINVPAGTTLARISTFNDATDGNDDIDLYVYNSGGTLVGSSGGGDANEQVDLADPAAGDYTVYVHGFATDGPDANYTLFVWKLGSADAGNMAVSGLPASATVGGSSTLTLSWSGLATGKRWLGAIDYGNGSSTVGSTIVRINS